MSATETRSEPRHMSLEPATLRALGMDSLSADLVHEGNVAAHVYRLAYGGGQGLTGINLGWADMEASTSFLSGLVSDIDEMVSDESITDLSDHWDEYGHETCDSAVPIYTREAVMAALDLQAEVDDAGLIGDDLSIGHIAQVALYSEATTIGYALVQAIIEAAEEIAEEAEEDAEDEEDDDDGE